MTISSKKLRFKLPISCACERKKPSVRYHVLYRIIRLTSLLIAGGILGFIVIVSLRFL